MKSTIKNSLLALATFSALTFTGCKEKEVYKLDELKTKFDSLASQTITEDHITPELLWKFGRVNDPQLSPDGKTIVYTVTRYSNNIMSWK